MESVGNSNLRTTAYGRRILYREIQSHFVSVPIELCREVTRDCIGFYT